VDSGQSAEALQARRCAVKNRSRDIMDPESGYFGLTIFQVLALCYQAFNCGQMS
jgi:hypothetical protein